MDGFRPVMRRKPSVCHTVVSDSAGVCGCRGDSEEGVDFLLNLSFSGCADHLVHRLAVLEEDECGHTAYAVFHCDVFTLLDVAFRYGNLPVVFFCQLCKDRGEGAARSALCSPEIDHYRLIAVDETAEILCCHFYFHSSVVFYE